MSNSHLIQWFEQLLFGDSDPSPPPDELQTVILRMESENIPWNHIILNGGLTAFPYQVHGDLNFLIDYLEKQWIDKQPYYDPPIFKTRVVSKFWDQIRLLLARRIDQILPVPSKRDDEILKELLNPPLRLDRPDYKYESAEFWGEVARRFIDSKRPEEPSALPNIDSQLSNRAKLLYEITCRARGRYFDPLSMHLVPHYEYLNAAHWQTGRNLEAFMADKPTHPLTLSVQNLLRNSIINLLDGKKPFISTGESQIDSFLHNINVIHKSIEQVPLGPPKLIDIFQRLLALCQLDGLWEEPVSNIESEPVSPSLLHLTEQVQFLEREKRLLRKVGSDLIESL